MEGDSFTSTATAQGTTGQTPVAPIQVTPAPAPPPVIQQQAVTPMQAPAKNNFFKNINWLETGFLVLGVVGMLALIRYYNVKLTDVRTADVDKQKQIDELRANLQSAMGKKYKSIS